MSGKRFVDGVWIRQRMQAKDDRMAAQLRAFRQRTGGSGIAPAAVDPVPGVVAPGDRAQSDRRHSNPDPVMVEVLDPETVFLCKWCELPSVNQGDFPFCSYQCRCEERTQPDDSTR